MDKDKQAEATFFEKRVVTLMASGKSVPQIAEITKKNVRTLEGHVERMRYKFGVDTSKELVAYFLRSGIIK